ncbi:MAG: M14/M99 family metallopeptidase [Thermodesulfobacteriota bacterium]
MAYMLMTSLLLLAGTSTPVFSERTHQVFFKGTDAELDVYTIKGDIPGPTLLLLGGIQGDEPGGYLAADLYADISLKKGTMIVVPRANFVSIVKNSRGVQGDMNRKFAEARVGADRDVRVIEIIKGLMAKSNFFLNLHDGSGYFFPTWESPLRNPMRYGQSLIADAAEFRTSAGEVIKLEGIANRVLEKVNAQIPDEKHVFHFNNHRTLEKKTRHLEQRLSATFHALTNVGIPAFGVETSKEIDDYRLRVRYQTMVVNAIMEECGIEPAHPRTDLATPALKYIIVSVNDATPFVVSPADMIKAQKGDRLRVVHIESNYSRGLSALVKGVGGPFNDLNNEVAITKDTVIEVRKDRFLLARIPVEIFGNHSTVEAGVHFEPKVHYFRVRVNDKTYAVEAGEELTVMKGDTLTILDPRTNLDSEREKEMRIDLRGFQSSGSPYPVEDRGHVINSARDLQPKYGTQRPGAMVYPLQAKLDKKVFGWCSVAVAESRLEYLVLRGARGGTFVAYPDDTLEIPHKDVVSIVDVKTNLPAGTPLYINMSGRTVRWRAHGSAGIDATTLPQKEIPLDVTREDGTIGRIWVRKGDQLRLSSRGHGQHPPLSPTTFEQR